MSGSAQDRGKKGKSFAELLKAYGVWDDKHGVVDEEGTVKELRRAKNKIALVAEERKVLEEENADLQRAIEAVKASGDIGSFTMDDDSKLTKQVDVLTRKMEELSYRVFESSNPEVLEFAEELEEAKKQNPGLAKRLPKSELCRILLPVARALRMEKGAVDQAFKAGADRAIKGNKAELESSSGAPVGSFEVTSRADLLAAMQKDMGAAKTDEARREVANNYERLLADAP